MKVSSAATLLSVLIGSGSLFGLVLGQASGDAIQINELSKRGGKGYYPQPRTYGNVPPPPVQRPVYQTVYQTVYVTLPPQIRTVTETLTTATPVYSTVTTTLYSTRVQTVPTTIYQVSTATTTKYSERTVTTTAYSTSVRTVPTTIYQVSTKTATVTTTVTAYNTAYPTKAPAPPVYSSAGYTLATGYVAPTYTAGAPYVTATQDSNYNIVPSSSNKLLYSIWSGLLVILLQM
jgi:hypothetical protein